VPRTLLAAQGEKEARLADWGPQHVGTYERLARGEGLLIGAVMLVALMLLAVVFFSGRRAEGATLDAGGGYGVSELRVVRGQDGWRGTVIPPAPHPWSDPAHVRVQLESGEQYLVPAAVVLPQPAGSVYVPLRVAELVAAPWEEPVETMYAVVPVRAEALEVQKRLVETGKVRMTKVVHERETLVDEPLLQDNVVITRVPIERVVEGPVPVREEHGTTMLSVVEEGLVVEKRWMLREEIHSRTQRLETHQPQRITLRSEDVRIERVPQTDKDL
jgi:uncharacterized protein (TIGR02271 family)